MGWEIAPARVAFPTFAAEWDRLNSELYGGHPYFDSRFVGPLLEYFGDGSEQLCIHRTETVADGALILHPRDPGRWALFLPSQAQAGPVLLRDASMLETLFTALPGYAWTIELLALDPKFCPDWSALRKPRTVLEHALTMAVALTGSFEDYWQSRPNQLKKNMRRYRRKADEQFGSLSVSTITEGRNMEVGVTHYGELETAGWKGQTGTAVSIDNAQGRFYEKMLRDFAVSDQATIAELSVGGRIAASRLIIRNDGMWVILKTTYNESFAAVAPGRQLLYEVLQQAFSETQPGTVEFYTDATRDQAEWATTLRYLRHHQLYRNELLAALHGLSRTMLASITRQAPGTAEDKAAKFAPLAVKSYQSINELPPETIDLYEAYAHRNVEFSPGWFNNLQQTVFAGDPRVRHYVLEFDGRPSAALPLRLVHRGLVRQIEALGNYYTSLYSPILAPESTSLDLIPLLEQANRDHDSAHVMRFSPMDVDSPAYEALLTALRANGWIPFRFLCFGNWFLKVEGNWTEYLKTLTSSMRSTIKRMNKKFSADGGSYEIATDPTQVESAIQAYGDVYAVSWKKPEPYPDFIPGLIRWLAATGKLRLSIARLAGRPIAVQLWIVSHGRAHIFKVAYDESYAAYSPGTLVTALLMEHVIDRDGVQEVDFLIGEDKYKQAWMNHRRERWGIIAYNPRTLIGLALLALEAARRLIRPILNRLRGQRTKK